MTHFQLSSTSGVTCISSGNVENNAKKALIDKKGKWKFLASCKLLSAVKVRLLWISTSNLPVKSAPLFLRVFHAPNYKTCLCFEIPWTKISSSFSRICPSLIPSSCCKPFIFNLMPFQHMFFDAQGRNLGAYRVQLSKLVSIWLCQSFVSLFASCKNNIVVNFQSSSIQSFFCALKSGNACGANVSC